MNVMGHTVPVGDILVGNARSDVKHDDAALPVDVVSISKTAELLLSCRVPDVELNLAEILRQIEGQHRGDRAAESDKHTVVKPRG